MEEIYNRIPCREQQLNNLFELFGEHGDPVPCSLFISGTMATGKSLCVESVLRCLCYKYVVVDCIECYTPKILYETVLSSLENDDIKCDSMLDFVNGLVRVRDRFGVFEPIVLLFDRAERLRNVDHSIICTLLRLRELCNLNICTVLITHLIYENFDFKIRVGVREPIKIYFPNYTKEELFRIIFLHHKLFVRQIIIRNEVDDMIRSEIENPELFSNFLNAFLSVFYRPCRDLIELKHMAQINFSKYCEPIVANEIEASNLTKLWRHIAPILKTSLELLYLRVSDVKTANTSPGKENSDLQVQDNTVLQFGNTLKDELMSTKTFAQSFELPYYAKYLLIAAYLASYNPPKEDKKLFLKNSGKQRKRMQQVKAKAKINEKLNTQLGPKMFTLDRLLAIFYAILEEKIGLTSNLLAQIATLVELNLIAGSKVIDLDCAKYKCIVGYDFITAVSRTVSFNIKKYLYDFI